MTPKISLQKITDTSILPDTSNWNPPLCIKSVFALFEVCLHVLKIGVMYNLRHLSAANSQISKTLQFLTETPDYLNLWWEGFGKEICFKLLSKGADGCGKAHVSWAIVPYSWSIKG